MKIAVLSGKGGTGKTLVSVNLAVATRAAHYIDCDVEEPNGHLFLKPNNIKSYPVEVKVAVSDKDKCIGCRKCVDFCKFNALAYIKDKVMVFNDVCHSCGGCSLICPTGAMSETDKIIGYIKEGNNLGVKVSSGILNTGEASGVPIINKLLEVTKDRIDISNRENISDTRDMSSRENISDTRDVGNRENINYIEDEAIIIDCPPGSACIVMESIKDADYCILVAEPTIFGAHNLEMVYELVKLFNKPHGVILNKVMDGYNPSEEMCKQNNIKILGSIPFDKNIGGLNSEGKILVQEDENYRELFNTLLNEIKKEVEDK